MKGISRRARACAVVAVTGVAVLAGSGVAQAQSEGRQRTGDGIPTGQMGTQMFNYGGYLNNGGNVANATAITGVSTGCLTGNAPACQRERLEGLFRMFQRRGTTNIELFGHAGFPATTINTTLNQAAAAGATAVRLANTANYLAGDKLRVNTGANQETVTIATINAAAPSPEPNVTLVAPLTRDHAAGVAVSYFNVRGLTEYRALLDKYGLHAGGQHGNVGEAGWADTVAAGKILGADQLGSGGTPAPGFGSYANVLATVETANRLGKYSVENGVGRIYIHNHQGEFRSRYVDNGVLKTAWQIYMERIDARYAHAEIDVFWSSDAYDDVTGTVTAGLINQFPTKVKLLHVKDGVNIAPSTNIPSSPLVCGTPGEPNCQNASPRPGGFAVTAERAAYDGLNFIPIFNAAAGRVQYYHHEQDGGTPNDANFSFTNLRGINARAVGTVLGKPTSFPSVPAGTPAAENVVPVVLQNTGDAPLTITGLSITADGLDVGAANDFSIVSQNCTAAGGGGPLAPSTLVPDNPETAADETAYATPRGTCTALVGFKPVRSGHQSVARLQITSGSDAATEQVTLTGLSTNDALGSIGGNVPTMLSLNIGGAPSFGSFVPAVARTYETAGAATVTSTAGDALLSVTDPSSTAPGHLVNGAFSLPQALQVRATTAASPNSAYQSLSETAGTPVSLASWTTPTPGAEAVTLGFRQGIGAADVLRAGSYSKTLTFTLSTTTP
jgi:hypothetical protein